MAKFRPRKRQPNGMMFPSCERPRYRRFRRVIPARRDREIAGRVCQAAPEKLHLFKKRR